VLKLPIQSAGYLFFFTKAMMAINAQTAITNAINMVIASSFAAV
jgi:hypothetical protein